MEVCQFSAFLSGSQLYRLYLTPGLNHNQAGDTNKGVEIIIDVVKGEGCAAGKPFPLILPLGSDVHGVIKEVCENTTEHIETWKDVICSTDVPA
ncbi:hypothetical protein PHLCEN_2v5797 [Hermanssonia centrifuga]|uniref:Uncharacterized protein n=1 Tax=Hermanssonia centrifuga TaxID=98765 RepID=A0A2R6P193_9APHY|nr:hypothetical protein PHLCEN_2v5797 [Hermanssonia centrifuga]